MLPLLLLSHIALSFAAPKSQCDLTKVSIFNGSYTVSDGGNVGSRVLYSCPKGSYPFPESSRECLPNGRWTEPEHVFMCRGIVCAPQMTFENGNFPKKRKYYLGETLNFKCSAGFERLGPETRTCQENGRWSGTTTTCENFSGYCPNPGIPAGAAKTGTSYGVNDKVHYRCQSGLFLIGSAERQCMENKKWSGAEPFCKERQKYDSPEEVTESFSLSIAETIAGAKPFCKEDSGCETDLRKGQPRNLFILLDASANAGEEKFNAAKETAEILIQKVSGYDIRWRFAVISYALEAKTIVNINDDDSGEAQAVIKRLKNFQYKEHGRKHGTNSRGAFEKVYNMLFANANQQRDPLGLLWTQNIIVFMANGRYNLGGDPQVEIKRMRELLLSIKGQNNPDIYSFGLGHDVSLDELNDLATKIDGERRVFHVQGIDDLKRAFNNITEGIEASDACGMTTESTNDARQKFPWIAKINVTHPDGTVQQMGGSIISQNFILTVAHSLHNNNPQSISVTVGRNVALKVRNVYRHPKYNPTGKKDKNIAQSFDYDLALIELEQKLVFSSTVRPICLPCTRGASRALRKIGATCKDHENALFPEDEELIRALFISGKNRDVSEEMNVFIKQGRKREDCLCDVKNLSTFKDVADIKDVTDKFLCTGGMQPVEEPQICKGDAGGPLIIQRKGRYIQVGVISWGTTNSCQAFIRNKVPAGSRDFHADVLHSMDWIGEVTKDELSLVK
ncbi:complement factor B-like isoform X2 [Hyperolius riggenbachi]|uniref:complement factor B-like isoform X2 n=1 Tax=Hyperolius riggenbachi TaxID=752182 RepID=UPI0035A31A5E